MLCLYVKIVTSFPVEIPRRPWTKDWRIGSTIVQVVVVLVPTVGENAHLLDLVDPQSCEMEELKCMLNACFFDF